MGGRRGYSPLMQLWERLRRGVGAAAAVGAGSVTGVCMADLGAAVVRSLLLLCALVLVAVSVRRPMRGG